MKRWIHATTRPITSSIEVSKHGNPRSNNAFDVKIDSFAEFNTIQDFEDYVREAAIPYAVKPKHIYLRNFIADISDEALEEGLDKWGDKFLSYVLNAFKNKSEFKQFIHDNAYNSYYFQGESLDYAASIKVIDTLKSLKLQGLTVKHQMFGVRVNYDNFNENLYDVDSIEHQRNWDKLVDFIKSMSWVVECYDVFRYGGTQVWADVYVDCNPDVDFTYGPIPEFEAIPKRY